MSILEANARAVMATLSAANPTLAHVDAAFRLIRDGDLIHVDLIRAWVMNQDAEFRGDLLNDLQELAAEEEHLERQRAGWPVMGSTVTEYAAHCIRAAGRGELLGDGL